MVLLHDRPFIGKTFAPVGEEMGVVRSVLGSGTPTHTGVYSDEYGTFVSGFAPIRERATGKIVALLDVDQDVSQVVAARARDRRRALWTPPPALALALTQFNSY